MVYFVWGFHEAKYNSFLCWIMCDYNAFFLVTCLFVFSASQIPSLCPRFASMSSLMSSYFQWMICSGLFLLSEPHGVSMANIAKLYSLIILRSKPRSQRLTGCGSLTSTVVRVLLLVALWSQWVSSQLHRKHRSQSCPLSPFPANSGITSMWP